MPPNAALDARARSFARLLAIVDRLRAPDGCPWDRKQTIESMAPHLVEEAHEALEAVEAKGDREIAEEAGDVLMVVCLICRIAEQSGRFDLGTAAECVAEKLVRRHPHVFGDAEVDSADEVLANWEAIKRAERVDRDEDTSALAGVPVALPALQRAHRICGKAVSAGFRWSDVSGAVAKLGEEQRELDEALEAARIEEDADGKPSFASEQARAHVEHELGDVLLSAAFLASYLKLDPERLCRQAVRRFEQRFRAMEQDIPRPLAEMELVDLVAAWQRAKEKTS